VKKRVFRLLHEALLQIFLPFLSDFTPFLTVARLNFGRQPASASGQFPKPFLSFSPSTVQGVSRTRACSERTWLSVNGAVQAIAVSSVAPILGSQDLDLIRLIAWIYMGTFVVARRKIGESPLILAEMVSVINPGAQ